MNRLQSLIAFLTYRKAVMVAEKAHNEKGERYFVIPNSDYKIKLIVTNRNNFRALQRKHYISQKVKPSELYDFSFYYTAGKENDNRPRLNDEQLKLKQLKYQDWYEAQLANEHAAIKKYRDRKRLKNKIDLKRSIKG